MEWCILLLVEYRGGGGGEGIVSRMLLLLAPFFGWERSLRNKIFAYYFVPPDGSSDRSSCVQYRFTEPCCCCCCCCPSVLLEERKEEEHWLCETKGAEKKKIRCRSSLLTSVESWNAEEYGFTLLRMRNSKNASKIAILWIL